MEKLFIFYGEKKEKIQLCEKCLQKSSDPTDNATHACFDCEQYLCDKCSDICSEHHPRHNLLNAGQLIDPSSIHNAAAAIVEKEGNIRGKFMEVKMKVYSTVKVRQVYDYRECYITGLAVLQKGDRAAVVDNRNFCLKILDLRNKEIIRYISFENTPWGVTRVPMQATRPNDEEAEILAVTFPNLKEISIMDITKAPLQIISTYATVDECYDVAFSRDIFITLCYSYDNRTKFKHNVCLLNIDGLTMKIIHISPPLSEKTFGPSIAAHPNQDMIFISSCEDQLVRCINYEGKVLKEFNFSPFGYPINVCIGADETLLISSVSKDKQFRLHRFSDGMSHEKSIIVGDFLSGQAITTFKDKVYTCFPLSTLSIIKIE